MTRPNYNETSTSLLGERKDGIWPSTQRSAPHCLCRTRSRKPLEHQYELRGHILETVSSAKYLGVTFNRDMNWSEYINNVCTKADKRNLKISSRKTKEMAYRS